MSHPFPRSTPRPTQLAPRVWPHVLHVGLTAILFNVVGAFLALVALGQLLSHLVRGEPIAALARLGDRLGRWTGDAVRFLSYASAEPPAPLGRRARRARAGRRAREGSGGPAAGTDPA